MADVYVFKVLLTGWSGGPGVNTWTFGHEDSPLSVSELDDIQTTLTALYENFRIYMPGGITTELQPEVRIYNDVTGTIVGGLPLSTASGTSASSNGDMSRAVMAKCQLLTGQVVGKRIVRGGVFMGPINGNAVDNGGMLEQDVINGLSDDLGILRSAGPLAVWHRPKNGAGGKLCEAFSVGVNRVPAILRSRRD